MGPWLGRLNEHVIIFQFVFSNPSYFQFVKRKKSCDLNAYVVLVM